MPVADFSIFQRTLTASRAWVLLTLIASGVGAGASALLADDLVSNEQANKHGLQRAWFAHIRVDRTRHRISNWTLDGNHLFALTTDGTVQAINAETGETLWVVEIATRSDSTVGLAVNSEHVAVLSATRLHILDRRDGRLRWSRSIGGAPSSSPALSKRHVYVALLSGRIEGYELEKSSADPWNYQSVGRSFHSPVATRNVVSWPTDEGYLYVGSIDNPRPLYRIQTNDEIVAAPTDQEPYLYVASLDGYLYCFHELTGTELWRYSTGFSIVSKPAIVGDRAFVASERPALHCIDSATGKRLWRVAGVSQFVAQGGHSSYGLDQRGTLSILDKETGSLIGRIATSSRVSAIVNDQSDRIFLVTSRGFVQCLREIGATEPTWYRGTTSEKEKAEDPDASADENPFEEQDLSAGAEESATEVAPTEEAEADDAKLFLE